MLKSESEAQPPIVPMSGEAMAEAAIAPVPTDTGAGRASPVLPMIIGYTLFSYRVFWGKTRHLTYGA